MLIAIVMGLVVPISLISGCSMVGFVVDRYGALRAGAAVLVVITVPPLLAWFGVTAFIHQDGPFTGVQCRSDQAVWAPTVTISADGFGAHGCVEANVTQVTFINSDDRLSFRLCVGRNGTCLTDSVIPDGLRDGVVFEPGAVKTLEFPTRGSWSAPFERSYPLTLASPEHPGNGDLVVRTSYYQGGDESGGGWG